MAIGGLGQKSDKDTIKNPYAQIFLIYFKKVRARAKWSGGTMMLCRVAMLLDIESV